MTLAIVSIGTEVPDTIIDQDQGLALAHSMTCPTDEQAAWLPGMYAGTRIEARHLALQPELVCDLLNGTRNSGSPYLPTGEADNHGPTVSERMEHYARLAPPLAIGAARSALESWDRPVGGLTHLITVSCTGFFAPGIDHALIDGLHLQPTLARTHIGFMGCHGALNGLRVARAFTGVEPRARVLLCAVELCSLHYHYAWDPHKMVANAIFADGAAALVGVSGDEAPPDAWRLVASGSCYLPNSAEAMTWTIGDHGYEMTLSRRVPWLIQRHLRPWLEEWLAANGSSLAQIRSWAIHPGGPKILEAAECALGLTADDTWASREIFTAYGNMSSPTVLFVLKLMMERNVPRPCVCLGFGPGLVVEAALLV